MASKQDPIAASTNSSLGTSKMSSKTCAWTEVKELSSQHTLSKSALAAAPLALSDRSGVLFHRSCSSCLRCRSACTSCDQHIHHQSNTGNTALDAEHYPLGAIIDLYKARSSSLVRAWRSGSSVPR
eukprot:1345911-Rhodomonas_salina.1